MRATPWNYRTGPGYFVPSADEKALADGITKSCQEVKTNGETAAGRPPAHRTKLLD